MTHLILGAIAIGGNKAVPLSIGEHHLRLHWVGLGMLLATILAWLISRWRRARLKRRLNSPRQLLRDLFRLHALGWSDRQLFLTTARRQKVKDAARLFLEPELWLQAIEAERSQSTRRRLAGLQAKLFAASDGNAA